MVASINCQLFSEGKLQDGGFLLRVGVQFSAVSMSCAFEQPTLSALLQSTQLTNEYRVGALM